MSLFRLCLAALASGLSLAALPLLADDTVTVCDQESLEAAIATGGTVVFDCDGTILLTNTISIADEITLDATGHSVTIASPGGTNGFRLFTVEEFGNLSLINLKLVDGVSTNGGAIFVALDASLTATSCLFSNNVAQGTNGALGTSPAATDNKTGHDARAGKAAGGAAGGAIYNLGFATLSSCVFVTNSAVGGLGGDGGNGGSGSFSGGDGGAGGRGGSGQGGAIYNELELRVEACTFTENRALGGFGGLGGEGGEGPFPGFNGRGGGGGPSSGAAIYNHKLGVVEIVGSTFSLNGTSSGDSSHGETRGSTGRRGPVGPDSSGGALANYGVSTLVNCTFFANVVVGGNGGNGGSSPFQGGRGGGGGSAWGGNVFSGGRVAEMYATNCTFSDGGAIGGTNGAGGSGPFAGRNGKVGFSRGANIANSNGVFFLKNCLIAYPSPGTNGYGKFRDSGFNLSSDRSIKFVRNSGSRTNIDPLLDVLHDNGGSVQTIELLSGSPAIDAGDTNFCLDTDARGVVRPSGLRCDIGSYEAGQRLLAPAIATQPISQIAQPGGTVIFRVVATGDPPLRYQWRRTGGTTSFLLPPDEVEIPDATNSTHIIFDADDVDEGDYDVVVSNNSGSTTSGSARLTVLTPPSIVEEPEPASVAMGESFTLTVTAEGDEPLRYRWLTNGVVIPGAVLSTYTVVNAQIKDQAEYQVEVCNDVSCVLSAIADVTVTVTPPVITVQPIDRIVAGGASATFSVQVTGSPTWSYFWRKDSVTVFSQLNTANNTSSLVIPNAQPFTNGLYDVIVTNLGGATTSTVARLTVQTAGPAISADPAGAMVTECDPLTLNVTATGSAPLRYQWLLNNSPVPGATGASLAFSNILAANAGSYRVVVTNAIGSVTSAPALVTVQSIPPLFLQDPTSVNGYTGETVTFNAAVCGSLLSYQWFFNSTTPLAGATNASLTIPNAGLANNGTYHLHVTNLQGAATSAPAVLALASSAPILNLHPQHLTSDAGTNLQVTFSVGAVGSQPLLFQWFFNDAPLSGPANSILSLTNPASGTVLWLTNSPNGSTLTLTAVRAGDEGSYFALATNSLGVATSNDGSLDVRGTGTGE